MTPTTREGLLAGMAHAVANRPAGKTGPEAAADWMDAAGLAVVPVKPTFADKYALIGDFHETIEVLDEDGEERTVKVPVSWTTIKDIRKAAIRAANLLERG